tara:strand:+ start:19 stop:336 length:318 start_codon:yes stop_codon:yes gene_type:complete
MLTVKNKKKNLIKEDIVKNIFDKIGIPSFFTTKIVDDLLRILITTLASKKIIKIKNFGTFMTKIKNERLGRNPKNKDVYVINKRIVATFSASNYLKIKTNNAKKK